MKRISRVISLVLCLILIFSILACSSGKEVITRADAVAREDLAVYDNSKVGFKNLSSNLIGSNLGAGSTNYLLYGYNVIANGYIDSQNINKRYAILDSTKLQNSDFVNVDSTRSYTTYTTSNYASSLLEKFNASADVKYKGAIFSGGMKTEYSLSTEMNENEKLIKYIGFYRVYEQYLVADNTRIRTLLSDQFKQDLASLKTNSSNDAIDKIFINYGTHLIQQYYLGGRFDLNFNFTSSSLVTDEQLKVSVDAAYANYSGSATAQTQKDAKTVTDNSSITFKAVGGELITGTTPDAISQQFKGWLDSLKTLNDVCEIGNFDAALLPIWELTDDTSVKTLLENRFNVLLEQAENNLRALDPKPKYITDIVVAADKNSGTANGMIPGNYIKVCLNPGTNNGEVYDANRSVGGDFIYIGYKLGTDKSQAIYDIEVWNGKDKAEYDYNGRHYNKIDIDLNRHAHGDYIYLFYSKAKSSDTQFIKEIRGTYGEASLPSGWQWTRGKVDLNMGAGGWYIYLAYRTGD